MVSGSRIEGGAQILSVGVRKTIQSIKEIVGNHSDADIYVALKETNMDPNETTQKLLNQDPFHEVKRKRDKKKEVTGYKAPTGLEPRKATGNVVGQVVRVNKVDSDHNVQRRGGFARNALPGTAVSREFRVVRDNRVNQNATREIKSPSGSKTEPGSSNVSENRGRPNNQKPPVRPQSSRSSNGQGHRHARNSSSSGADRKDTLEERQPSVPNGAADIKINDSSDPVHVPSLDSRPHANKREVGVVGVRRHFPKNNLSAQATSSSSSHPGPTRESSSSFRSLTADSETNQPQQIHSTVASEPAAMPSVPAGRSIASNHQQQSSNNRSHQQITAHHKASQPNKEWKPKSSKKPNVNGPGVIGTPSKSASPPAVDSPKDFKAETVDLQENVSRVKISDNQNVIIAAHIRVSETDRSRLTFGSLGAEFDPLHVTEIQAIDGAQECIEPSASISVSAPESSSEETFDSKQEDSTDERGQNSGSRSPVSDNQLTERKVSSSSPQNLGSYGDIGLVHDDSTSYTLPEPQQQQEPQDHPELPTFSAYDPQSGYDIRYFRPVVDETLRGQGLLSPQEDLSSQMVNSMPASTIAMVQQQQQQVPPQVAQMYPQVHFANLMPYRQYISPVYVPPPMAMHGYSSNPTAAYPHPSNASSYVLMPGGSSPHLTASGLKYGIQQFKPIPTGSPAGFGNFTSPTGYSPGVVGGVTGIEDSSRIKYKDGNLYIPNPQAETSEIWMNPRDLPSLQSASYYNMAGQVPHGATYLPSHTGHHASFNGPAVAQSSHMQFSGLYHQPQQAAAIASPHHMGPANIGAAAPGPQLGAYQQPQLGHLNWTGNF